MPRTVDITIGEGGHLSVYWSPDVMRLRADLPGLRFDLHRHGFLDVRGMPRVQARVDPSPTTGAPMHGIHPLKVVQWLAEGGPGRPAALAAVASFLPTGVADLYRVLPERLLGGNRDLSGFYHDWPGSACAPMALAHPGIAVALPTLLRASGTMPTPALDPRALLAAYAPGAVPAMVERILSTDWFVPSVDAFDALLGLPPDWFPDTAGERDAFGTVARHAHAVARVLGHRSCLSASRGRWAEYRDHLLRKAGIPVGDADLHHLLSRHLDGALDMSHAFARQALIPAMAHAGTLDGAARAALFRERYRYRDGYDMPTYPAVTELAARLLFDGRSLGAVIEDSVSWHGRMAAMDAALAETGARHPPTARKPAAGTWPVPFAPATAPNGVEIRFLATKAELLAEGSGEADADGVTGLSHCVGGYARACASGADSIASLRRGMPDGAVRLSTAQVHVGKDGIRLGQHSGRRNGKPPPEAQEALDWFVAEVAAGRIGPDPGYLAPGWRRNAGQATIEDDCGFDWRSPEAVAAAVEAWSRFLPRPLRSATALSKAAASTMAAMPPWPSPRYGRGCRPALARACSAYDAVAQLPLDLADRNVIRQRNPTPAGRLAVILPTEAAMLAAGWWLAGAWWGAAAVIACQLAAPTWDKVDAVHKAASRPFRSLHNRRAARAVASAARQASRAPDPAFPPDGTPAHA